MSALAILSLRGTRNPHVLTCTLRFLRAVRAQYCIARQIFISVLVLLWKMQQNAEFCDAAQGARRVASETVRRGTASLRAPRNTVQRTKNAFGGVCL